MILPDTNVVSEIMRPVPDRGVLRWLDLQPNTSIWTTSITIFEVRYGLCAMLTGKRRTGMTDYFERWIDGVLQHRIVNFDESAAQCAAELAAMRQIQGRPGELRNTMIAGIVLATHATLATRKVRHFEEIAASVVNPWEIE
jgi:hypothetical protein